MYTREEVKAIVDKVINMAKADAVEVSLNGGERSGTRWANSSITTNLVQYDRQLNITVHVGDKIGTGNTRDFSDAGLQEMVDAAVEEAKQAQDNPNRPELLGPQDYIPVDGASPDLINFSPLERAKMVRDSIDAATSKGVLGAGYIPKDDVTTCNANSKGLFAYYRNAVTGFDLTCRMPDGSGSGWAGLNGIHDLHMIDAKALTDEAADTAIKSRNAKATEPGRYTVIMKSHANARFLSLITGSFGGGGGRGGGFLTGKKVGDKVLSDLFTLKSDVGNPILRQTSILADNLPAKPVTWVENGILKAMGQQPATVNNNLVMVGSDLTLEDMIKQTRRGLLVSGLWYIRGVPAEGQPLLNTGMTRDGLFLIENGEIVGPVQNFRWNMSPIVGYNNLTLVGKPMPMATGEAYSDGGIALVPPVRIDDFYMTSISPAV